MTTVMMDSPPKRVGIIVFQYPITGSSSHINIARILAQKGYLVDFFLDTTSFNSNFLSFPEKEIRIIQVKREEMARALLATGSPRKDSDITSGVKGIFYRRVYNFLVLVSRITGNLIAKRYLADDAPIVALLKKSWLLKMVFIQEVLFAKAIERVVESRYNFFLGSDANGLIAAGLASEKIGVKIVYLNLELMLESECITAGERLKKRIERELNRKSEYTIIPDEARAEHLIHDNNIDREKILLLPVSAFGDPFEGKTPYFRSLFKISPDKIVVLHAGNIAGWTYCKEIAESALTWPEPFVLVIHTWRTSIAHDPDLTRIKGFVDNRKIFLSLDPVPWDRLPELLAGADIGLAFYKNLGKNFLETGSSSNKLAQYLQVGLPVITSDYPTFRDIINRYACGKCTNDFSQLGSLLAEIQSNYQEYRKNAFTCFSEVYEFSRNFDKIFSRIQEI